MTNYLVSPLRRRLRRRRTVLSAAAAAALAVVVAAAAAVSLAAAACSSGSNSGTASSGGSGGTAAGGGSAVSSKYPWCGPQKASIALADGFGDNTWRELTRYSAVTVAAQCPSITGYTYTNGEGNTQKAISDINSLVA